MKNISKIYIDLILILIVLTICFTCLNYPFRPIIRANDFVYDTWMKYADKSISSDIPVIVDVDEKSLEKIGQWPWPHTVFATLIDKILESGALAIGLDIIFSEPDRTSPITFKHQLKTQFDIDLDLTQLPPVYLDNDKYLSEVIKNKPVVLGTFAEKQGELKGQLPQPVTMFEVKESDELPDASQRLKNFQKLILPLEILFNSAPVGIIAADVDQDRVVRSVPLLVQAGENVYAALALRTLMAAMNTDIIFVNSNFHGIESIKSGDIDIPSEYDGIIRPFYRGSAKTFPYISVTDILDNNFDKSQLDGKIVFIGSSAAGLMDSRATPLDMNIPGVEIHATILDNILTNHIITIPDNEIFIQIIGIFFSGILAYAIFGFLSAFISLPLAILAIAGALWGSFYLFEHGIFLTPVFVIMAILLMGALLLPYRFWAEQKAKTQIKNAFGHYVSPEVVNRIAASDARILNGENREVSVLFTDVRNFTTISEKMAPEQLVAMLNSYFTPMTACVRETGGTLDKFIGDALMAFWNAPLNVKNHQKKAVLAAMAMQKKLKNLRQKFIDEFGAEIKIGAGIHSGIVQVGSMGSDDLRNYTCIGDNVNLASRLESLSKRYGAGIIVSSDVMEKCDDIKFRRLDRITVKGSSKPLDIFTPLDNNREINEESEKRWEKALQVYFQGDFTQAINIFKTLLDIDEMKTAASLFIDRCQHLKENPAANWNGVWNYDTK